MEKYSNFKNVSCPKSQTRGKNFRIAQMILKLGKIVMITIMTFSASIKTADAQRNTFADAYMKFRQPKEGEEIMFEKLKRKDIRKLLAAPEPKWQTETERQEYLSGKAMLTNARQISMVLDMEEKEGLISSSQFSNLLRPYDELISMKTEDMWVLVSGVFSKRNRVKELIVLMSDTEDDVVLFANILFKKPIAFHDYMGNPENISRLFSVNSSDKENDNALIKINYNKSSKPTSMNTFLGLDDTLPVTFEVVQVDGKYGVQSTQNPFNRKYLLEPTYEIAPIIYGNNPGNTYIVKFYKDYCYLLDKFGFIIAHGYELSPVYVLENEEEIAAFIIRDSWGYSLYECPETYTLIQQSCLETGNFALRPRIERRILNCKSIVPTEDGRLECVKADGTIELIPIRKQNPDFEKVCLNGI